MAYIMMNTGSSSQSRWKSWTDGTDEEITEMLQMHYNGLINIYDFWRIGDERQMTLSQIGNNPNQDYGYQPQQTITLVLMGKGEYKTIDGTEGKYSIKENPSQACAFVVGQKAPLSEKIGYLDTSPGFNEPTWNRTPVKSWCNNSYREALPSSFVGLLKSCKHMYSYDGSSNYTNSIRLTSDVYDEIFVPQIFEFGLYECEFQSISSTTVKNYYHTLEYYDDYNHRIKTINDEAVSYWTGTSTRNDKGHGCGIMINQNGICELNSDISSQTTYIAPHMFI